MAMDLKGRNFLKLLDFTPEEIEGLLDLAADLTMKLFILFLISSLLETFFITCITLSDCADDIFAG